MKTLKATEKIKILIIEDDKLIRQGLRTFFEGREYKVFAADTGIKGLELAKQHIPHIVLLDITLPDISGIEILQELKNFDSTIRVIMVSARSDIHTIEKAHTEGASDYVVKPFSMDYLNNVVVHKIYYQILAHQKRTIVQIIYALAHAFESKVPHTKGHSAAVAKYAQHISDEIKNVSGWEWIGNKIDYIKNLGLLHDIGKIKIEDAILKKEGALDEQEREKIKRHPLLGANIVSLIEDLSPYAEGILSHHEWYDGNGYPYGLKGKEIPPEARIISVADAYDAMISDRPYRKSLSKDEALNCLIDRKGIQFDPEIVDSFIRSIKKTEK
ncbi:HD-GYP domain-containing protein [bacterium]